MITPAEWIQARIDRTCLTIEEGLSAPNVNFPYTVYLPGETRRDLDVAHGVVQNLVINGWNARQSEGSSPGGNYPKPVFSSSVWVTIDLPEGPLHVHDTAAAVAGWDALRERCAWFETLYARFVGDDVPKVGSAFAGMRFGRVDKLTNEIADLRAELESTRADLDNLRDQDSSAVRQGLEYLRTNRHDHEYVALAKLLGRNPDNTVEAQIYGDVETLVKLCRSLADCLGMEPRTGRRQVSAEEIQAAVDALVTRGKPDPELLLRRAWFEELGKVVSPDSPIKVGGPLPYPVKIAPATPVDRSRPVPQAEIQRLTAELDSADRELDDLDKINAHVERFLTRGLDDEVTAAMEANPVLSDKIAALLDLAIKRDAFPDEDEEFEDIQPQLRNGGGGENMGAVSLGQLLGFLARQYLAVDSPTSTDIVSGQLREEMEAADAADLRSSQSEPPRARPPLCPRRYVVEDFLPPTTGA